MTITENQLSTFFHAVAVVAAFAGLMALASTLTDSTEAFDNYIGEQEIEFSGDTTRSRGTRANGTYNVVNAAPVVDSLRRGTRPIIAPPEAPGVSRGPRLRRQS